MDYNCKKLCALGFPFSRDTINLKLFLGLKFYILIVLEIEPRALNTLHCCPTPSALKFKYNWVLHSLVTFLCPPDPMSLEYQLQTQDSAL